jgi:hypothetical protein
MALNLRMKIVAHGGLPVTLMPLSVWTIDAPESRKGINLKAAYRISPHIPFTNGD